MADVPGGRVDPVTLDDPVTAADRGPVRRRWLDVPGGRVAALAAGGSGTPVLLVPGYTGSKEDFLPLLAPLAAAGYPPVAVDQRGQFESVGPDDPAAYTIDALAADVHAMLRLLGRPAHLVGHSFGGLVARAAVLADPSAVASLTLLDSGPAAIGGGRRARMEALEPFLAGGMRAVYERMEEMQLADPGYVPPAPRRRALLRRRFLASSPVGLQAMGDALRAEPDRTTALRRAGVPVLVAYGEADDGWPPSVQAEMAGRLGARHASIPGAAHSPAREAPGETVRVLLNFWAAGLDGRRG